MAEDIIVGGVGEIVNRLIALGFDEVGLLLGVKEEMQNLQGVLNDIRAVLQDAEEKQVEKEALRVWLKDLKEVAYDAEDLLDEVAYEELRRGIINNKACSSFFSYGNRLVVRLKIAHKIKDINQRLGAIDKRKNMFQLTSTVGPNQADLSNSHEHMHMMNFRETCSLVDDSTVVGRENDKEKIVDMLINHGRATSDIDNQETGGGNITLSVITIVGLGGLGKTTLAQLVYNDDTVKNHFDLKVWICVSNNFEPTNLFSKVLEQIVPHGRDLKSSSKQLLQNNLESQLNGKKFLLVLDDVWNEVQEEWDDFALPFKKFGATGSKIVVTSRSHIVASIVGAQDTFRLQMLSDDSCWTLFERRAFMQGGARRTSNLVEIGKEIVKKCKGVPLAAKVLGGLMHSKKEESEWLAVQNGEISNITLDEENQILKVLKLSYDNLPPALKSCFSYCAVFPKDHWISREFLIQLWMAQGLLATSRIHGKLFMEDTGNTYLNILYSKSFFQEAETNKFGEVVYCKMHDLVHDLAQSIRGVECQVVDETNKMNLDLSKCRHASLISKAAITTMGEAKKLRTIFFYKRLIDSRLMVSENSTTCFNLKLLRVLDLSHSSCSVTSSSLGKLKHLRYLDLSDTAINSLPKWVTRLYHLQTLILESCNNLYELPDDLINLKNLRHLFIDQYREWKKMPRELDKLHFLQTLSFYLVGKEHGGRRVEMLQNLNALRGSLRIYDLGHVKEASSAKKADLIAKGNLRKLILGWSSTSVGANDSILVLEELRPHSNLRGLSIENFGGVRFPQWVSSGSVLPNLVSIKMSNCNGCEHIPSFSELPRLETLKIMYSSGTKSMGAEGRGSYCSLKRLEVLKMENLEEWLEDAIVFPSLEEMSIRDCPSLRRAPHSFPSLKSLKLDNVGGSAVTSITTSLTSLTSLSITNCQDLTFLQEGLLRKNDQLSVLQIKECPKLQAFLPDHKGDEVISGVIKSSLRKMSIDICAALISIPDVGGLTSLEDLHIWDCPELQTIPHGFLSSLVSLEKLYISCCPKLKIIGGGGVGEFFSFPSLQLMDFFSVQSIFNLSEPRKHIALSSLIRLDIIHVQELAIISVQLLHSFKHLQHLQIDNCPTFCGFDLLTNEKDEEGEQPNTCFDTLKIRNCPAMSSVDLSSFTSLRELNVIECQGLQSLKGLQFLTALEMLRIGKFSDELHSFPLPIDSNNLLTSLRELHIWGWPTLQSLPHQLQHLTTLKTLFILYFDGLTVLPEWLGNLTLLECLSIRGCKNLTHLPSQEQMQRLTLLKLFGFDNCPHLKERCSPQGGAEWPKISHIPDFWS